MYLWLGYGDTVSWRWWNLIGSVVCILTAWFFSRARTLVSAASTVSARPALVVPLLLWWFALIIFCGVLIQTWR